MNIDEILMAISALNRKVINHLFDFRFKKKDKEGKVKDEINGTIKELENRITSLKNIMNKKG